MFNKLSPSTIFSIPFILLIVIALQIGGDAGYTSAIMMVVGMMGAALVFVFRQQIHWYWYSKTPPAIDPQMIEILVRKMPYFKQLAPEQKAQFLRRMSLFQMAKEIESLSEDNVPADIKGQITAAAVQIGFGKTHFLFPNFKKIIVYPSLFRSAEIKELHACETFIDPEHLGHSCVIFAADYLMQGYNDPVTSFNTALYEMASVFRIENKLEYQSIRFLDDPQLAVKLALVRRLKFNDIQTYLGKPKIDPFALAVEHFFMYPARFKEILPELFQTFKEIFNQDPTNVETPVITPIDYFDLPERKSIY